MNSNRINLSINLKHIPFRSKPKNLKTHPILQSSNITQPMRFEQMYFLQKKNYKNQPLIFNSKANTPNHSQLPSYRQSQNTIKPSNIQNIPKCSSSPLKQNRPPSQQQPLLNPKQQYNKNQQKKQKIDEQQYKIRAIIAECHIQHSSHKHIRQNQCFLSKQQVYRFICDIGYDVSNIGYVNELFRQLQIDKYEGIPLNNLKNYLMLIQKQSQFFGNQNINRNGCLSTELKDTKQLPQNIIDHNLNINISIQDQNKICEYFSEWRITQNTKNNTVPKTQIQAKQPTIHQKQMSNTLPQLQYFLKHLQNHITSNSQNNQQSYNTIGQPSSTFSSINQNQDIIKQQCQSNQNTINTGNKLDFSKKLQPEFSVIEDQKLQDILKLKQKINQALNVNNQLIAHAKQQISSIHNQQTTATKKKRQPKPILSVNVTLPNSSQITISVLEGETPRQVCQRLTQKYSLSEQIKHKFETILSNHLKNMLWKIQELSQELLITQNE